MVVETPSSLTRRTKSTRAALETFDQAGYFIWVGWVLVSTKAAERTESREKRDTSLSRLGDFHFHGLLLGSRCWARRVGIDAVSAGARDTVLAFRHLLFLSARHCVARFLLTIEIDKKMTFCDLNLVLSHNTATSKTHPTCGIRNIFFGPGLLSD
jgi:hypothetical protein